MKLSAEEKLMYLAADSVYSDDFCGSDSGDDSSGIPRWKRK